MHAAMCETVKVTQGDQLLGFMCYPTGLNISISPEEVISFFDASCDFALVWEDGDVQSFKDSLTAMYQSFTPVCKVYVFLALCTWQAFAKHVHVITKSCKWFFSYCMHMSTVLNLSYIYTMTNTQIHARQRSPHSHSTESMACITGLCHMHHGPLPHASQASATCITVYSVSKAGHRATQATSHITDQAYSEWLSVGKDSPGRKYISAPVRELNCSTILNLEGLPQNALPLLSIMNAGQVVDYPGTFKYARPCLMDLFTPKI
jgi:hypothetical protein